MSFALPGASSFAASIARFTSAKALRASRKILAFAERLPARSSAQAQPPACVGSPMGPEIVHRSGPSGLSETSACVMESSNIGPRLRTPMGRRDHHRCMHGMCGDEHGSYEPGGLPARLNHPASQGRWTLDDHLQRRATFNTNRAVAGGFTSLAFAMCQGGAPRWRRVCRPLRHYKRSLMQMTSSSASSTIGQPRSAA